MVVDFSKLDLKEQPVILLKNSVGKPIGTLGKAKDVSFDIKFNEASVLEFTVPAHDDGKDTPHYDSVVGLRIVDIEELGQFVMMNPVETGDGVKKTKQCKCYSLEYEFTFKNITLENSTYNFWNPAAPEGTLLDAILTLMPTWGVGHIDDTLVGRYRTFEAANTNLYNFIKSTAQQSYNCIFDFDTRNRLINVIDLASDVPVNPVYLSNANLAKEISITENTENIVTRLEVNGADGVDIRDVNPSGTNTVINLDHYMTTDNFDQALIDKYNAWKTLYDDSQQPYYNLSVEYALRIMCRETESAALNELNNELVSLNNQLAVTIQAIAQGLTEESELEDINTRISEKQEEILQMQDRVNAAQVQVDSIYNQLRQTNDRVRFERFFTEEELRAMDMYIKEDALSESSFVYGEAVSYSAEDICSKVSNLETVFLGGTVTMVTNDAGKKIFDISGGRIEAGNISADVVRAAMEIAADGSTVATAYLGTGRIGEDDFPSACLSISGTASGLQHDLGPQEQTPEILEGTTVRAVIRTGYLFFTRNTSEYERRAVAWELYDYGSSVLKKLSQPSYTFSVDSANFLCLEDFTDFKNSLRHGQKIYIGISDDETLSPICTGVQASYEDISSLKLEFGDTYTSDESAFRLADLLEQSVSMGKSVDLNKFVYSSFVDSGASTRVHEFIHSALDVSKNAILSTKDQAISWDESGIRLRKWANEERTAYEPEQVWMSNNSIMMTRTNWSTAEIAIGKFHDKNLGTCYGIVAPNVIGTLLAGNNLVIESEKKDGSTAVFRVDASGCALYNSTFDIVSKNKKSQLSLDPQFGIAIGKHPLYTEDSSGARTVDTDNARLWADIDGNLTFQGTLRATTGEFDGKVTAREGYIGDEANGWTIGSTYLYNGKSSFSGSSAGIYIGTDGISIGDSTRYIKASKSGVFTANSVVITGDITATSGKIGGFTIDGDAITYNGLKYGSSGTGVYIGPSGLQLGSNFRVSDSGDLWATSGTFAGSIYAGNIIYGGDYGYLHGNGIASSSITGGRIASSTVTGGNIASRTVTGGNVASGTISTTNTTDGINTTLGYADYAYGVVTGSNPAHFSGGNLYVNGHAIHTASVAFADNNGNTISISYLSW